MMKYERKAWAGGEQRRALQTRCHDAGSCKKKMETKTTEVQKMTVMDGKRGLELYIFF